MKDNHNLDTVDYDPNVGDFDPRFEANKMDAILFHGVGIGATIVLTIVMYLLGSTNGGDASNITYVFGYPLWWFVGIGGYVVMLIWGLLRIRKWKEFPLTARYDEKEDKK